MDVNGFVFSTVPSNKQPLRQEGFTLKIKSTKHFKQNGDFKFYFDPFYLLEKGLSVRTRQSLREPVPVQHRGRQREGRRERVGAGRDMVTNEAISIRYILLSSNAATPQISFRRSNVISQRTAVLLT